MLNVAPAVLGSGNLRNVTIVGEIMPNIKVNTKVMPVNNISNLGTELEISEETLKRWNDAMSKWWEVQLEIDKLIQQKVKDDIQESM